MRIPFPLEHVLYVVGQLMSCIVNVDTGEGVLLITSIKSFDECSYPQLGLNIYIILSVGGHSGK